MRLYTILNKLATLVNQHTSQINSLNSKTIYASFAATDYFSRNQSTTIDAVGRIYFFGNVCVISLQVGGVQITPEGTVIGTLSRGFATAFDTFFTGFAGAGSAAGAPVRGVIDTSGKVTVYGSANTTTVRFTIALLVPNNQR